MKDEGHVDEFQDGAIVSMTPLGSSPGGEVFYVSSEEPRGCDSCGLTCLILRGVLS